MMAWPDPIFKSVVKIGRRVNNFSGDSAIDLAIFSAISRFRKS